MLSMLKLESFVLVVVSLFLSLASSLAICEAEALVGAKGGRKGVILYVSKRGDNSDGTSWGRAFHTIQAALSAVPDAKGGHRIVVRPDIYMEANLFPAYKGVPGAYNLLVGDFDGSLGSSATGWVVIDSSDPEKGYKSYDWWSTMRAYLKGWSPQHTDPTFSSVVWDRWMLRYVYATGGDAGLFWDLVAKAEPFTVIVEDSVGIGRAFGGGVANHLARAEEPCVFRRCHLWCLDWWGDAGAAYVRAANTKIPARPDAVFEDCTLVAPDNALEVGYLGCTEYTRVKFENCRMIVLNFSQPQGTPSTGIIHTPLHGNQLQVDLEDCTMMGYKVFGDTEDIIYTIKGRVEAYVQYQQSVPEGFVRLARWPVELFRALGLPAVPAVHDRVRTAPPSAPMK